MNAPTQLRDLKKTAVSVAADAGIGNVKAFFESQKSTLAAVLPKHVPADRMLKIALGALRTTPKLMQARTDTLLGAIIQCAQLGLEPNTPLGHAYLIPFENRNKGVTEVQIVFGYKGLIDLARRSGQIVSIAAHEVRQNDHFEYEYGLEEKLVHRPAMGDRGEVIAFYAVAKLVGGGYAFEVMSLADIIAIRDASQGWKQAVRYQKEAQSPWGAHFVEMGRKTVLRRLFKFLPVSIEIATAAALDDKAAAGETQGAFEDVLQGDYTVVDGDGGTATGEQGGDPQPPAATDGQQGLSEDSKGFVEEMGGAEAGAPAATAAPAEQAAPTGGRQRTRGSMNIE